MIRTFLTLVSVLLLSLPAAAAQVTVSDAWVRATMPGQKTSGAYLEIQSDVDARLVAVTSPVASRAEVHEMTMDGDVMRMREIGALDLPRGKPVALEPGGFHIMLLNLTRPIVSGAVVPLTLVIESNGRRQTLEVKAVARAPHHRGSHGHAH